MSREVSLPCRICRLVTVLLSAALAWLVATKLIPNMPGNKDLMIAIPIWIGLFLLFLWLLPKICELIFRPSQKDAVIRPRVEELTNSMDVPKNAYHDEVLAFGVLSDASSAEDSTYFDDVRDDVRDNMRDIDPVKAPEVVADSREVSNEDFEREQQKKEWEARRKRRAERMRRRQEFESQSTESETLQEMIVSEDNSATSQHDKEYQEKAQSAGFLSAAREGRPDDLKIIRGVGPELERLCHKLGVFHFDQIANWSSEDVEFVNTQLEGFQGRISRDDWVGQAKILAAGGETEFSRRQKESDT